MSPTVARHRTALSRTSLSRPLVTALTDRLVDTSRSLFDYGCGHGDDLRYLAARGFDVAGWDPVHRPDAERWQADIVNLGYVINVIENPEERAHTLQDAWSLTEHALVVAARLIWDARDLRARPFGDGVLTRTGTFQKFYEQAELATWIEQTLGRPPIAAAPGIFYVFRDPADGQQFLADRVRASRTRITINAEALYEAHQDLLTPLIEFLTVHGRLPHPAELEIAAADSIKEQFGSLGRALAVIRKVAGDDHLQQLAAARRQDLLVYIALSRFDRRPRASELPTVLGHDIRALFGSYRIACQQADRILVATGNMDTVDLAACASPAGKHTPTALYVHKSALGTLPPVLRVYEGCARVLVGTIEEANVIKLSVTEPKVSYLAYPRFDRDAHPALATAVTVNLRKLTVDLRDYSASDNPPVLHRKEEFLTDDHPRRDLYSRLTKAEERAGLYQRPAGIGTQRGWQEVLAEHGVLVRGHRLYRSRLAPRRID